MKNLWLGVHYWVPSRKYQLVDALSKVWPADRAKFNRYTKKRCYAIWFSHLQAIENRRESNGQGAANI